MKKLLVPILLVLCLPLCSCGNNKAKDSYDEFSGKLRETDFLTFDAALRSEYDDKTVEFAVRYSSDEDGASVTVIKPDLISGICARIAKGETELRYDGAELYTGKLTDFGLSPMSALPMLIDGIRNGYADSVWEENGELVTHIEATDDLSIQLRFDKYTMTPLHAELISGNKVKVFIDIENWNTI